MLESKNNYELGFDIAGRHIVMKDGKYVTHIPANLSSLEVIKRLDDGETFVFDARNQGLQNNLALQVDEKSEVKIAPPELWPFYEAWYIKFQESWTDQESRNIDQYKEYFFSFDLTMDENWQIIKAWYKYIEEHPEDSILFDQFREKLVEEQFPKETACAQKTYQKTK